MEGEQERERTDMCADGHGPRALWGTEGGWGLRKPRKVAGEDLAVSIAVGINLGEQDRHFHTGKIREKTEGSV